jgi:hypothetical protein
MPGVNLVRAHFRDAEDQTFAEIAIPDPPWHEARAGFEAGAWPGAPFNSLPPECRVVPLGHDDDTCYFVGTAGQLRAISRFDADAIFSLFGLTPNFIYWAWPRFSMPKRGRPSKVNGFELNQAKQCLWRAAQDRGVYDPVNSVRGRGAWVDDTGSLVWHSGDALWRLEGAKLTRSAPAEIGRHYYVRGARTYHPWRAAVSTEESPGRWIFETLRSWQWARPIVDPVFALGALGCGLMSGALQYRPNVFVTGDRGTGKTTLQDLFRGVWGAAGIALEDATEAGIAQLSQTDVLPISFDELEARADNRRGEAILGLARIAYSGASRLRGSTDHDAKMFNIRSCFVFSAINPPPMSAADRSRMVMLNLHRITTDGVRPGPMANRDDAVGRMLVRRMMEGWPDFLRGVERWRELLRLAGLPARMQDTYGALLSAAETLVGQDVLEEAGLPVTNPVTLGQFIADETFAERLEQVDNWAACLMHLLRAQIEFWKAGERPTIGQAVRELMQDNPLVDTWSKLSAAGLGATIVGHKINDTAWARPLLCIPMQAHGRTALAKAYDGTQWAGGGWGGALRQAPPEVVIRSRNNVVKIDGFPQRCFLVDPEALTKALEA